MYCVCFSITTIHKISKVGIILISWLRKQVQRYLLWLAQYLTAHLRQSWTWNPSLLIFKPWIPSLPPLYSITIFISFFGLEKRLHLCAQRLHESLPWCRRWYVWNKLCLWSSRSERLSRVFFFFSKAIWAQFSVLKPHALILSLSNILTNTLLVPQGSRRECACLCEAHPYF